MKYFLFCILGMLASCNKDKTQNIVIDIHIDAFLENSMSENLLLGSTPNAINPDSIKLQYLINGAKFTVYNSALECPRSVCTISDPGSERMRFFPNNEAGENYPVTYINWGNGDTDTLKCHFTRRANGSAISCDTLWFNDVLMYPDLAVPGFGRAIKIVK